MPIITAIILFISLVDAFVTFPGHYGGPDLSRSSSIYCSPISVADGQRGEINVTLISITMELAKDRKIPDIPVFIFRLKEREKFDNIMDGSQFMYGNDIGELYNDEFEISVKKQYANEDIEYYNGKFESSQWNKEKGKIFSVSLEVSHTGLYCTCILLPVMVKEVVVYPEVRNSFGYFPLSSHLENIQLGYFVLILSIVVIISSSSLFIKESTRNPIPVYYVLGFILPLFSLKSLTYTFDFLANRKHPYIYRYIPKIILVLEWLRSILSIIREFILLLISMGIGSIYQNGDSPSVNSGRELPVRLKNRAVFLLTTNVVFCCLGPLLKRYNYLSYIAFAYFSDFAKVNHVNAYLFMTPFVEYVENNFWYLWLILRCVYYFKTLRKVQGFKTTSNDILNNGVHSFKMSIYIMFLNPMVTRTIFLILSINGIIPVPDQNELRPEDSVAIHEALYFDQSYNHLLSVGYLSLIIEMCAVYFIWIDTNTPKETTKND